MTRPSYVELRRLGLCYGAIESCIQIVPALDDCARRMLGLIVCQECLTSKKRSTADCPEPSPSGIFFQVDPRPLRLSAVRSSPED